MGHAWLLNTTGQTRWQAPLDTEPSCQPGVAAASFCPGQGKRQSFLTADWRAGLQGCGAAEREREATVTGHGKYETGTDSNCSARHCHLQSHRVALGKTPQRDQKFKASLGYTVRSYLKTTLTIKQLALNLLGRQAKKWEKPILVCEVAGEMAGIVHP